MLADRLFSFSQAGAEVILWLLILLSFISVGLIIFRYFTLRRHIKNTISMRNQMKVVLQNKDFGDIKKLSSETDTLEGRALKLGLSHVEAHGASGLSQVFQTFTLIEKPQLDWSLSVLATIGSNAPFIGLLGTVLGIMKAFKDLSANLSAGGNEAVMAGIAEALVSTAVGLVVAIPAVVAYNAFQKQVKSVLQSLETSKELCVAYALSRESKKGSIKES